MILQVILLRPIFHHFDYLPPQNHPMTAVSLGVRIEVPFGKKNTIGFLIGMTQTSDIPTSKLKHAITILDKKPLLTPSLLHLIQWASHYYQHPLGEIIKASLPKKIREDKNFVLVDEETYTPHTIASCPVNKISPFLLQSDQIKALQTILATQTFQTFLLDGVTGSGKTEIYLQAITQHLEAGKQALVLVPEIGLTPQTIERFKTRFNRNVVVFHSQVSEKEKFHTWQQTVSGAASVIIGTRSAIFAPLKSPGIIIIDEEHDPSFKQQTGFRYSARDLAIIRAKTENIPIILGSATPSLESFHNVALKKFQHLTLTEKINQQAARFYLIDIKNRKLKAGISAALLKAIQKHLQANNQVLIFLNRRGFSPILLCHHCGWIAQCQHCDAKLVWHQGPQKLLCHHCHFTQAKPPHCPSCQQAEIMMLGTGTEKLEATLSEQFKEAAVIRIDKDTTRRKGALQEMLEKIRTGRNQILIGTQMLAKGHHFPNLTMVAILDADSGLYSPDFKSSERMGQLITQVAGRAGRGEKPGEIYIQTHHPHHPWLQTLIQKDYQTFAQQIMDERKKANFPPFHHLAVIRAEAKKLDVALSFLWKIKKRLKKFEQMHLTISTPIPAWMEKKSNAYHAILMINSSKRILLHNCLEYFTQQITQTFKSLRGVRWSLEVDPIEVL